MKAIVKFLICQLGLGRWLNFILYHAARARGRSANNRFRKQHPQEPIPPDAWLFETYKLDYRQFLEDGLLAAREIRDWTAGYLPAKAKHILDWGCGAGRIIRHFPQIWPGNYCYGCDTDAAMIEWNRANYPGIDFIAIDHHPPTSYNNGQFQLVFGFSVFTHIGITGQKAWLAEMHRLLSENGVLLVTTHGAAYRHKLAPTGRKHLEETGMAAQSWPEPGRRMLATYHTEAGFSSLIGQWFNILAYYDGEKNPRKAGGQDLWILQKKPAADRPQA